MSEQASDRMPISHDVPQKQPAAAASAGQDEAENEGTRRELEGLTRAVAAMRIALTRLCVTTVILALVVAILGLFVWGDLLNYHAGYFLLYSMTTFVVAAMGFGAGWFTGRRIG